jgi:hypothetical protein
VDDDDAVENLLTEGDASIHYITGMNLAASPESRDAAVMEEVELYNRYHNNHVPYDPIDHEIIEP